MTDKIFDITAEAEAFCEDHGIKLSTLGLRALNNGRFFDRYEKRLRDDEEAVKKIRQFMTDYAPKVNGAAQ